MVVDKKLLGKEQLTEKEYLQKLESLVRWDCY